MSRNFNDNEPPKRDLFTSLWRTHNRTIYTWLLIAGTITAIAAMSGWMGMALPFWLIGGAIFLSRLDSDSSLELGTFWGGIAILLIMAKVVMGWPWFVWLLVAFPAYVGFASLMTALYNFVSRMFRS